LKDSYLTAGIKFGHLFQLVRRNKVSCNPKTIFRLVFLFQSAVWSSFFSWIEQAKYKKVLKSVKTPEDPIFIIGHWRTGSTFLHQLMHLDPGLSAPSLFEVAVPDSFLVSHPYYRPIFKNVVSEHRPMDQVKIGMDEPQEDEYAIYRITNYSPLENLVFPKSQAFFLNQSTQFLPDDENELDRWKKEIQGFYKKIFFRHGKRIVSKNPFNSFRTSILYDMFPGARFIHIVRNPFDVVPSTIHMWTILGEQNSLNTHWTRPGFSEVVDFLKKLAETVETDQKKLPAGKLVEIRFEDLEKSPVDVLKKVYAKLELPFTSDFEDNINKFLHQNASFKKNTFTLTAEEKSVISQQLENQLKKFNYQ
jgi:hypothetical protein